MTDPFDLKRFVDAQAPVYQRVLSELRRGQKQSHWMWFIFPQLAGLGHSPMALAFVRRRRPKSLNSERIRSRGRARGFVDPPRAFKVLGVRAFPAASLRSTRPADLRHGVPTFREPGFANYGGRPLVDASDHLREILRQSRCADLLVRWTLAVQQQVVRDALVGSSDVDAFLAMNRHAPHDQAVRQRRFDSGNLIRSEQRRRCAKVDDGWLERPRPLDDQGHSRREKERRKSRRRHYRSRSLRRLRERLFAWKLAVANQNPNVVDTNLKFRASSG